MFKSYIIKSEKYYLFRKYSFWFFIISNPILFITIGALQIDNFWYYVFLFLLIIISIIISLKFKPASLINQQKIIINENQIQILNKDGSLEDEIQINENSEVNIKNNYELDEEKFNLRIDKNIGNFIIIKNEDFEKKIYFLIDSYYMLNQLNKIISQWSNAGIRLVKI